MPFKLSRFLNSLSDHTDKDTQERLMQNRVAYDNSSTSPQAVNWIGNLMEDLEAIVGVDSAKAVMEACGQQCIGLSVLEKAKRLQQESHDIEDLLEKLNNAHIGGGYFRREEDHIYASYERCYCGSVSKTRLPITTIYCQCSCGWYRKLFETILGKPVRVELVDSIIHGASTCQFIIHI
jgi:predicted ArsR family transcriptional regulator